MKDKAAASANQPHLAVTAEVHDDMHVSHADFDATAWFEQASDEAILGLARIDWGGNYEADAVAEFFIGKNVDVDTVFETKDALNRAGNTVGFECYVDETSVLAWLQIHRPALWRRIMDGDRECA